MRQTRSDETDDKRCTKEAEFSPVKPQASRPLKEWGKSVSDMGPCVFILEEF